MRAAASRRSDMGGLEVGVDREAAQALLTSTTLSPSSKSLLRRIVSGGVWTGNRAYRARLQPSAVCPFCRSGDIEDNLHMWWKCDAWAAIRNRYGQSVEDFGSESWPMCLRVCGIMAASTGFRSWVWGELLAADAAHEDPPMTDGALIPQESYSNGRVIVFIDGACTDNQSSEDRRAGIGGFWGEGNALNFGELVRLGAAVNGLVRHRYRWRAAGWRVKRGWIANADLWRQLDELLAVKSAGPVIFTKVKAHMEYRDVEEGGYQLF